MRSLPGIAASRVSSYVAPSDVDDILGLYARYKANLQPEANLGAIATLVDQSGNGRDFAQATGSLQPFLRHSDLNGKHSIQFGESTGGVSESHYFERAQSFMADKNQGSLFMVMKSHTDPGVAASAGAPYGSMDAFPPDGHHMPWTDRNLYTGFMSFPRKTIMPQWDMNQWNIVTELAAVNDYLFGINGYDIATAAVNAISPEPAARRIGFSRTLYWRGRIAEMLFYDRKVSAAERQFIVGKLATEYGLTHLLEYQNSAKTYVSAQRWRIRAVDTSGSNDAFGVMEFQMYTSTDGTGTNLCTGGTPVASHNDASYLPTKAFNGNTADFWTSLGVAPPSGGHWIGYIFPSAVTPKSLRIYTRGAFNETPNRYVIEYSTDAGVTWNPMRAGGFIAGDAYRVITL